MHKIGTAVLVAAVICGVGGAALAEEMKGMHHHHDEHAAGMQTLTGEVIDVTCYVGHNAMGSGHADCAKKCIKSGLPVAIKVGDELLLAVKSDHTPANELLASFGGKQVQVTGEIEEKDGMHVIAIKEVKAL